MTGAYDENFTKKSRNIQEYKLVTEKKKLHQENGKKKVGQSGSHG